MQSGWRSRITIRRGDITDSDTDAIVNAANNDLVLGAGVAGAIRRKGGPSIQAACDRIGPIPLGDAAITGGGNLKARHVIHAASMRLGGTTSESNLRSSTRKSLCVANEQGLKSIAFPAIGTGIAGFPLDRCAEVMLAEVREHLSRTSSLERVEFVLFDDAARETFERALKSMND
ncbi:MAG TPA: macro domain-containing protein [Candidatus Binataceae bacterium]|nr:macro domain-containing protein [Candidatus Binataceae bacterium]